jgi:hypothetical protein
VSASKTFTEAVTGAEHLTLKSGLSALKKKEGAKRIHLSKGSTAAGSVDIDKDCEKAYPEDPRWDYLVGVVNSKKLIAYYIEVHSAESSQVRKMAEKLQWLVDFVREQEKLAKLTAEYHWVASGRVNIPKHTRQYKQLSVNLRKKGLVGPVTRLDLG